MQQNIYTAALPTPPVRQHCLARQHSPPPRRSRHRMRCRSSVPRTNWRRYCDVPRNRRCPYQPRKLGRRAPLCCAPAPDIASLIAVRGMRGRTDSSAPARPRETEVSNSSLFASRTVSAGNSAALVQPTSKTIASTPQLLSRSAGDLFHPSVKPRCVAPCPSTARRKVFRRALRCGQPACAGKWRRPHGSGEPPCKQRRFPAASCRLPGQGPDR